ncbi:hypothetical protein BGZ63DRAFT_392040 [Mariannaea sp. PMI_226]|nr:hypothetical protein BGZ63DRAFT_392040 [Mariannaea sp. PMI_226]
MRSQRQLLVAKKIPFEFTCSEFEQACCTKLSKPQTVKFFWRKVEKPWHKHRGWVMLGFRLRSDCRLAEEELKSFEFHGQAITIERASRVAVSSTYSG